MNGCIHFKKIILHIYVKICPFFKLQNHLKENGSYFFVNTKRKNRQNGNSIKKWNYFWRK